MNLLYIHVWGRFHSLQCWLQFSLQSLDQRSLSISTLRYGGHQEEIQPYPYAQWKNTNVVTMLMSLP